MLGLRKGRNPMAGSGDCMGRWTACGQQAVTLQNSSLEYSQNAWASNVASWNVVCSYTSRMKCAWYLTSTILSSVPSPRHSRNSGCRSRRWSWRGEALNSRKPVVYLGFEYQSPHEAGRRGFTVKPTDKHVDECLVIDQLRNAKAVMTPLTEMKSTNLHDETTVCDQAQHTMFRAVVGKLQYITGVRPDLMFATKCLSYELGSPTLADLTRAKKSLRYLKGARDLKPHLTIPSWKPNDLCKNLKHVTGFFHADWAGDPVTRKSTSCTLCYVAQFLLTSECRGQGTVALSSGESELYALGALSAELIFAQAILKEIGLSFPDTHESRQQHSTGSCNETRSKSQGDAHSHEIPFHSRFGIPETADDVRSED